MVPLRIVLQSLLTCLTLFPSSLKQIVGSNRHGTKKRDLVTALFEEITRVFLVSSPETAELSLRFLCRMFKARDKSNFHFNAWVKRCLANVHIFMDAIRPRLFSEKAEELNKQIPQDTCFSFVFDQKSVDMQEKLGVLTIKDFRDHF